MPVEEGEEEEEEDGAAEEVERHIDLPEHKHSSPREMRVRMLSNGSMMQHYRTKSTRSSDFLNSRKDPRNSAGSSISML